MKPLLRKLAWAGFCGALLLSFAGQAGAGEKGKYVGKAVLKTVKFAANPAGDGHPGTSVMMGEDDGVIFNQNGGEFLNNARYQVVWTADKGGGRFTGCYKTFTAPSGDKVFAECVGAVNPDGKGAAGTVKLVGGTGRYASIRGDGKFTVGFVAEGLAWDVLEWNYEIP